MSDNPTNEELKQRVKELERDSIVLRQVEAALWESEKKYQDLYDNAPDMFASVNAKTATIINCNQTLADKLGYTKEEIIGRPISDMHSPISAEYAKENIFPVFMRTGIIEGEELQLQRKDGGKIDVNLSITGVSDEKGNILQSRLIWRDITERKKLEAQLQQSQKMEVIGTLAGGLAHDFNNILNIIIGNTELAVDNVPERNPAHQNLVEIRQASLRARDVVKQILAFSRHSIEEKKPIRIAPIITESLKLLRASIPTTIEIRRNLSAEQDTILADATQINQVLINLCTNAAYSMRENGGVLEVNLDNIQIDEGEKAAYYGLIPGDYIRLTVNDTGSGIEPEIIERIFDPYFTIKSAGKGNRMGLAVVHRIIKSHGGNITANSEPGKGATFEVVFPVVEIEAELEIKTSDSIPRGTERILFIDDEMLIVKIAKQMLYRLGYQVDARISNLEALEVFRKSPDAFDLIITDYTMPNMTGRALAKELMCIRPDIPIILCTGFNEQIDEDVAKKMGIKAFVMKPIGVREIATTIREVLDNKDRSDKD